MFAFYDYSAYLKQGFPFLLSETDVIERYLESQAGKGKVLACFSRSGLSGYFTETTPKKYHYCTDVYYRPLKEEDLDAEEFSEYKETCLACGWKYVCAFENIVIFYSEEELRPLELQTDSELKRDILRRITLRTEIRQMLVRLALSFFIIALYTSSFSIQWTRNLPLDKHWWDVSLFFLPVLIILAIAGESVTHLRILFLVWKERPIPKRNQWWNRSAMVQIGLCIWALFLAASCFWFRFYFQGICAVLVLLLMACELFHGMWASKKQGIDYHLWIAAQKTSLKILSTCVTFLLLFIALLGGPVSDSYYRFSLKGASGRYEMDYKDSVEEDSGYNMALSQEDVGFTTHTDSWRVKENPGHYTESESLIYRMDPYPEGIPHAYEQWFYVGTLTARLSDEGKLTAYLREKRLTLDGAEKQELVPGVDSYLLPSGTELVHIKNDLVIIHFLDKRDARRFSLEEPAVREAVAAKVRAGMELHR